MSSTVDKILICVLTPLSWLYGFVTWVRNKLFDVGVFKEEVFDVPIVSVGNLTVGGTGKTPHVEYIVDHLSTRYRMAVLSRGYKRSTSGFLLANSLSTPSSIGDEPMQIYRKYGMVAKIAVCENRSKGIKELLRLFPDLELIVLDDAFQHRWVKPKVSVLLMDHNRPVYKDKMLPLGRLREGASATNRADMVIVTKCPEEMLPIDYRIQKKELALMPYQQLFFSRYHYGEPTPVFPEDNPYHVSLSSLTSADSVFLLTGIAYPRSFVRYFRNFSCKVKVAHYPDHHDYSRSDLEEIRNRFKELKGARKIIVTTEKDAMRIAYNPYFPTELKKFIFYIPVNVKFINMLDETDFLESLVANIEKNPLNQQQSVSRSSDEGVS